MPGEGEEVDGIGGADVEDDDCMGDGVFTAVTFSDVLFGADGELVDDGLVEGVDAVVDTAAALFEVELV